MLQIYWEESTDFVTAVVNVTSEDAYWTVSLPRVASAITRTSCYGTKSQCLLASSVPCNNLNLGKALSIQGCLKASPGSQKSSVSADSAKGDIHYSVFLMYPQGGQETKLPQGSANHNPDIVSTHYRNRGVCELHGFWGCKQQLLPRPRAFRGLHQ